MYHNDTNHFTVILILWRLLHTVVEVLVDVLSFIQCHKLLHCYINIVWAATYGGGAADGCIVIYHNDTNHFTVISILCVGGGGGGVLRTVAEVLVDVLSFITMTQSITLLYQYCRSCYIWWWGCWWTYCYISQ